MVKRSVRRNAVHLMNQGAFSNRRRPLSFRIRLLAGAVGVLAGLRHLLFAKDRVERDGELSAPASAASIRTAEPAGEKRRNYFSIRRTKSELGYVYWVLQGHGEFQCFVLFDTWREAVDEALCRVSDFSTKQHSDLPIPVAAG